VNSAPFTILVDVRAVAAGQELQRLVNATRGFDEALTRRILAEGGQHLPNEILHQRTP
jgi:hypothetical protein